MFSRRWIFYPGQKRSDARLAGDKFFKQTVGRRQGHRAAGHCKRKGRVQSVFDIFQKTPQAVGANGESGQHRRCQDRKGFTATALFIPVAAIDPVPARDARIVPVAVAIKITVQDQAPAQIAMRAYHEL